MTIKQDKWIKRPIQNAIDLKAQYNFWFPLLNISMKIQKNSH